MFMFPDDNGEGAAILELQAAPAGLAADLQFVYWTTAADPAPCAATTT